MRAGINRQILLVEKPSGKLGLQHFRLVESEIPKPSDGEVLLRIALHFTGRHQSRLDARSNKSNGGGAQRGHGRGKRR